MSETKLRQQTADGSLQQTQAERDSIGICCRLPPENCRFKPLLEAAEEVVELGLCDCGYCHIWQCDIKRLGHNVPPKDCVTCPMTHLKATVEKAKGGGV